MMPASRIASISSEVATGRRMNGRDGLIAGSSLLGHAQGARNSGAALGAAPRIGRAFVGAGRFAGRRCLSRSLGAAIQQDDFRAVAQLVGAVDNDLVSRL